VNGINVDARTFKKGNLEVYGTRSFEVFLMIFQATTKKQLTLSNYRFINQYAFYKKRKTITTVFIVSSLKC